MIDKQSVKTKNPLLTTSCRVMETIFNFFIFIKINKIIAAKLSSFCIFANYFAKKK